MFWKSIQHIEVFRRAGERVSFERHQELPLQNRIALLEKGICGVSTVTATGFERTYLYFREGNLMGFLRHLLPLEQFPASHIHQVRNWVTARTQVECTLIEREEFFRIISARPECQEVLTVALAQNLSNVLEHSAWLACESAPVRLCAMLLAFSDPRGDVLRLPRCFTQAEISHFLSLHKITVAKVLKALGVAGYIERKGHVLYLVDAEALQQIANREISIQY